MKISLKVLLSILVTLILVNGALIIYDIRKEIQINRDMSQKDQQMNDQVLKNIYKQLKDMNQKIEVIPFKMQFDKVLLEKKLQQVNVMIHNTTMGGLGSGVSIKYKDNYYILSAGHMAQTEEDELELWENDSKVCDLEIVKHDFTFHDTDDYTNGNDLILLRPKDKNIIPRYYVELADMEPTTSTEVYIVGNPMGIEDVVSEGRIAIYINNFLYLRDGCYFGNSGGGVYTLDGKLVGIVSHLNPQQPNSMMPAWILDGIVRLNIIKEFIKDVA